MKMKAIHAYVAFVCALAVGAMFFLDWTTVLTLSGSRLLGVGALIGLALLSESLALTVTIARNAGNSSITFIPLLACQMLFGAPATVVLVVAIGVVVELFIRRKGAIRALFNVAQWTLAIAVGGWAYNALGGSPLAINGIGDNVSIIRQLIPFGAFTLLFLSLNHVAVSLAIAFDQGLSFSKVWKNRAGRSGANIFYDLLISPVAVAVAFLYVELKVTGILVTLLPLLFIRRAYLTTYELQEANRDLMKALVKAIETRDPYTSGHSVRVAVLSRRIAEDLGLSRREVESIETAALLHDIGKIEAVYTEILRKPGSLTSEERQIIESHVTKGVELLESLSSVSRDVIGAVRHHHERVDGNGYPDGLMGQEIPIGARIIKVCDAIDAMLSDRPYREALELPAVREQLTTFQSVQFDPDVVQVVISSKILEEHRTEVKLQNDQVAGDVVFESAPSAARA